MIVYDVIVVGGGISGIYSAYLLLEKNPKLKIHVLEGRDRLGGRLYSPNGYDMGATWSWPQSDTYVTTLAKQLQITSFDDDDEDDDHSYLEEENPNNGQHSAATQIRFVGGTEQLVTKLAKTIESKIEIQLQEEVQMIRKDENNNNILHLCTKSQKVYQTKVVLLAIPPRLILSKITFQPSLPLDKQQAMISTPTWMAGASKVFLEYSKRFWRTKKKKQQVKLPRTILNGVMVYDASQHTNERYALCSFHAGQPMQITTKYIHNTLLPELEKLFGHPTNEIENIVFYNWMDDPWTCDNPNQLKQENHVCMADMHSFGQSKLREPFHSIYFASTETESEYGHIQGALKSGQRAVAQILPTLSVL